MNKRIPSNRSTQRRRPGLPQGELQAVMALRALRLPGAPAYPSMSLDTSLSSGDVVCPYCGRASLVVGSTDFGAGHLAEGICSVCGTWTRCFSARQEGPRLPWLIAVEAFA
jgi:hypothetical protein